MTSLSNKIMVVGTLTLAVLLVLSAIAGSPDVNEQPSKAKSPVYVENKCSAQIFNNREKS